MTLYICPDVGSFEGFEGEITVAKYDECCNLVAELNNFRYSINSKKITNNELILLFKMMAKKQLFIVNF